MPVADEAAQVLSGLGELSLGDISGLVRVVVPSDDGPITAYYYY